MSAVSSIPINEVAQKRVWGRTFEHAQHVSLFWTGSGVEFVAKSSEFWIEIEADFDVYEPWISILINGECMSRQMLHKGRYWLCVFRQLSLENSKHIHIIKDVQAMSADSKHIVIVHAIKHDGLLLEVPQYSKKIEFIGDSITSGEGAIGAKQEQDWVSMWFSAVNNYTRYTAQQLNAEYRVVSQSGWGVYSSWDENRAYNIPSYYEQVCGMMEGETQIRLGAKHKYNFSNWQPDYVVINLGTNDGSAFKHLVAREPFNKDSHQQFISEFQQAIVSFLTLVRKHNPHSHIIWAYGMLGYQLIDQIIAAIDEYKVKSQDQNVVFCRLPNMTDETIGSRFHPGQQLHISVATILSQCINELISNKTK